MDLNQKKSIGLLNYRDQSHMALGEVGSNYSSQASAFLTFSLLLEYWPHPKSSLAIVVRGCSASLFKGIYITRKNMLGL